MVLAAGVCLLHVLGQGAERRSKAAVHMSLTLECCRPAQADVAAGEAEIALLSGKLADANSTAEGAHASAGQAAAKIELLTSACDTLHNDLSGLTAERVRVGRAVLGHSVPQHALPMVSMCICGSCRAEAQHDRAGRSMLSGPRTNYCILQDELALHLEELREQVNINSTTELMKSPLAAAATPEDRQGGGNPIKHIITGRWLGRTSI